MRGIEVLIHHDGDALGLRWGGTGQGDLARRSGRRKRRRPDRTPSVPAGSFERTTPTLRPLPRGT